MNDVISGLFREALMLVVVVGLLPVGVTLAVSIVVSLVQAAAQLQDEATATMLRLAGVALALVLATPWVALRFVGFAERAFAAVGALP